MPTRSPLYQHPFLRGMAPEHRTVILNGAEEKSYAANEVLFSEGQPANRLFLLHEGEVALETHVPAKGDVRVASVGAGQLLGWSWLVPPFVWHFQGRALQPVKSTVLNGAHLLVASEQNHYLGYELMKGIRAVILDVLLVAHQRWLEIGHPVAPLSPVAPATRTVIDPGLPLRERLALHPFFHGIKPDYLEIVSALASPREFEAGQLVLETGALADGLYVLESGTLRIESPQASGARPVQIVPAGGAVGWSSFCEPYEWHFNVRAIEPASMQFFKAADLRERCAGDYHFAYELTKRITRMMLQHLQSTRHRMWEAFH